MHSDPVLDVAALEAIVTEVTQTIFESAFVVAPAAPQEQLFSAAVTLAMQGAPSYLLTIAWRSQEETAIQHEFTQVMQGTAAAPPVSDILGETLNIVAGQIKSRGALDHRLGLPQRAQGQIRVSQQEGGGHAAITLRGKNAEIWLEVAQKA
jgi:hypothetical protein